MNIQIEIPTKYIGNVSFEEVEAMLMEKLGLTKAEIKVQIL